MAAMAPEPGTQERREWFQSIHAGATIAPHRREWLSETGGSAVIAMLHVIAGEARIYRAACRAALGDGVRGARSRLVRIVSARPMFGAMVRVRCCFTP